MTMTSMNTRRWGGLAAGLTALVILGQTTGTLAGSERDSDESPCQAAYATLARAAHALKRDANALAQCATALPTVGSCTEDFRATSLAHDDLEKAGTHVDAVCQPAETRRYNPPEVYRTLCSFCHDDGLLGAPKRGDAEAWNSRRAMNRTVLYENTLKGQGHMIARQGARGFDEAQIKSAVDYLLGQNR